MTIGLPGWLEWLADKTVGHFPEGDEDALWRMRDAYTAAATAVQDVAKQGDDAAHRVGFTIEGATADAFATYWKTFSGGGDDAYLTQLEQLCTELAASCDGTATEIEYTKLTVIAALVALAAEVAALVASAFFDFGASAAAIEPAEAATAAVVRQLITELIENIVRHVLINVVIDGAIQTVQIAEGHRNGYDVGKLGHDAFTGAISGVAGFAGGKAVSGAAGSVLGEDAGKLTTAAVHGGLGVVAGVGEEATVVGIDQGRILTPGEALRGGVQGGIGDAQDGLHERGTEEAQTNAAAPPGRHAAEETPTAPTVPQHRADGADDGPSTAPVGPGGPTHRADEPTAAAPRPAAPAAPPPAGQHRSDAPVDGPSTAPPRPGGPEHRADEPSDPSTPGRHESTGPQPDQNIPPATTVSPNRVEDAEPDEAPENEGQGAIPLLNL